VKLNHFGDRIPDKNEFWTFCSPHPLFEEILGEGKRKSGYECRIQKAELCA